MRFFKLIVIAPLTAVLLAFAFANRESITVYFDPLGGPTPPPLPAPAYVVLLVAVAVGVVIGSIATWFGQGKHRRAARVAQEEAARLRADLQAARSPASSSLAFARRA
jgi:hypothetical protein